MKKEILGYIAGVLDVRGSIILHKIPLVTFKRPTVRLNAPENRLSILECIQNQFGGCITQAGIGIKQYVISGDKCVKLLANIKPLIKSPVKRAKIELILDAFPRLNPQRGCSKYWDIKLYQEQVNFEKKWNRLFGSIKSRKLTEKQAQKIITNIK